MIINKYNIQKKWKKKKKVKKEKSFIYTYTPYI